MRAGLAGRTRARLRAAPPRQLSGQSAAFARSATTWATCCAVTERTGAPQPAGERLTKLFGRRIPFGCQHAEDHALQLVWVVANDCEGSFISPTSRRRYC